MQNNFRRIIYAIFKTTQLPASDVHSRGNFNGYDRQGQQRVGVFCVSVLYF